MILVIFEQRFWCVILGTLLVFYLLLAVVVATVCFFGRRNDPVFDDYPITWIEHFVMDGLMWPITILKND